MHRSPQRDVRATVVAVVVMTALAMTLGAAPGTAEPQDPWLHRVLDAASAGSAPAPGTDPALDPPAVAREKLTDAAEAELRERPTDFWVRFADQADLTAASRITDWDARGAAVRDALVEQAEASQAAVVAELADVGADYTPFWVSNAVLVKGGDLALATRLASHREVTQIREVVAYRQAEPVESLPAPDGAGVADDGVAWGVKEIGAPEVWAQGITGQGIVVANIDSGVDITHPALRGSFRGLQADGSIDLDYNWYDVDRECWVGDPQPCDGDWPTYHGTHTMGTIVGDGGEGNHIGVAPGATWIAADGCADCTQSGLMLSAQWMLAPLTTTEDWAAGDPSKRPHVINNSWGRAVQDDPFFDDILAEWDASGIFSAWSVGNSGPACETAGSPGSRHVSYSVGAYDVDGEIGYFSSRGPGQDGEAKPNIAAPGVRIRSAAIDGGYRLETGTSMAAPHLAGAVALLWSAAPALVGDIAGTRALLDRTARDVDDTRCGGDADDNGVWGEGKLDVAALVAAAPKGAGTLTGTVTGADGAPLADVDVAADGEFSRTTKSGADGTFALPLVPGTYTVTLSSFGFGAQSVQVTVPDDGSADASARLVETPRHAVSGTVTGPAGTPVAGLSVALAGPLAPVVTDAAGRYVLDGVPEGTFALTVDGDRCLAPGTASVAVDGDETADVALDGAAFGGGYACTTGVAPATSSVPDGAQELDIRANQDSAEVELPFAFPSFDGRYSTAYVSSNGFLTFGPLDDVWAAPRQIPFSAGSVTTGVVAPFWALIDLDERSRVLAAQTTVDGLAAITIEWRDVHLIYVPDQRVTFSATLVENGDVVFSYGDGIGADGDRAGWAATVGLEAVGGQDGAQLSRGEAVLSAGDQIRWTRPESGWVSGTITDANDGAPVPGAAVTVTAPDGTQRTATTSGDGTYTLRVPPGAQTVTVAAPHYEGASGAVTVGSWRDDVAYSAALRTGVATVTTPGLSVTSDGRGTQHVAVTVSNTGTAPLHVTFGEMARNVALSAPEAGVPVQSVFGAMPVSSAFGLGYDGRLWLSDWVEQRNLLFSVTGERLGVAPAVAEMDGADRLELAFDARTGEMCQIVNGGDWSIHCFDRDTGEQKHVITGYWADQLAYNAVAHNPVEDVFYLGSYGSGTLLTVAGTTHPQPGKVLSACAVPDPVAGLAYNPRSDTVWYSAPGPDAARLVQVDPSSPSTCTRYRSVDTYVGADAIGGIDFDESGNLWLTEQDWATVWRLNVEDPIVGDVAWLDPNQDAATLKPGQSRTFKVKVQGAQAEPGTYAATLLVDTDAGRAARTYLPVDLTRSSR